MTLGVFTASVLPTLTPFLKYGKTLQHNKVNHTLHLPLDIQNIYIPKKWFTHFYIIHFIFSAINCCIIELNNTHVPFSDIHIICIFNLIQSTRRLYECIYVSKFSSKAKIHLFHYLVGLIFYSSINIIPLLMYFLNQCSHPKIINIVIAFIIFLFASYDQWINHNILSNQIKYTLPNYGLFKYVICPHYFDESMIYLSLLIIKPCISFIIIFLWVLINLTISANQSYIFYKEKKEIKISNHYIIIPFIY